MEPGDIEDGDDSNPRQAVYMTVYHGNGAEALSNARILSLCGNSLLVLDERIEFDDRSGTAKQPVGD